MRYQPLYRWQMTKLDANDEPSQFDWLGSDGDTTIGRIRKEFGGPTRGLWQWSGHGPVRIPTRPLPHQGYCKTAREAVEMVETYYHRLMRENGRRGSADRDGSGSLAY